MIDFKSQRSLKTENTVSSGYNRTAIFMNSRQLWLLAPDQISQHSSTEWKGAHARHPPAAELWRADGFWWKEKESQVFSSW